MCLHLWIVFILFAEILDLYDSDDSVEASDDSVEDSDESAEDCDDNVEDSDDSVEDSDDCVEHSDDSVEDSDDSVEDSDNCVVPTHKHQRICNEEALQLSLSSGRYPEYLGIEGPQDRNIHRHVILWILNFYYGLSPSVI